MANFFQKYTLLKSILKERKEILEQQQKFRQIQQHLTYKIATLETELKRKQDLIKQRLSLNRKNFHSVINKKNLLLTKNAYFDRLLFTPWQDKIWQPSDKELNSYKPRLNGLAPEITRIGEITQIGRVPENQKTIPALIPIRALSANQTDRMPGHLVIFSKDPESRQLALAALQSIALRIISTFPARKLKAIFIDPVSMGNNFPFNKLPDFISGLKTYTRSDDIREELRSLTIHIEQVIQNYLGINYQTIENYNTAKSSVAEPYRYLFMADFPTNIDRNSWEDLKSLLVNGARAGVYAVLHVDLSLEKPRDIDYKILENYCTVLKQSRMSEEWFEMQLPSGLNCQIILDKPPNNQQFNQLIEAIAQSFKAVKTETVSFAEFYPEKTAPEIQPWLENYDSRREIRAPIGVMGAMENLEFWMGSNEEGLVVSQGLLAGKPGAGKSYTLHAIIISLAMRYSPDELEMYLLDFKEGVEFQIYVDPERSENSSFTQDLNEEKALPHAKVVSIESDREFGLSVLKFVQAEIETRGSKFRFVGVNNLSEYREKCPQEKMPRILVIIDEFQYMFQERDSITSELNLIFEDITRRGRAFGVHLLIASQSPKVPNMSSGVYSFIELRMAQQMDKNTAKSVLAEGNVDAVDLLDKPGKVIYNKDFGRKGHNDVGQVADVSPTQRIKALLKIQAIAAERNYQRSQPLILFNGTRPTKLNHNRQLMQLSQMSGWLSLAELNKQVIKEPDWLVEETPRVAWLGEAMRIGNHIYCGFTQIFLENPTPTKINRYSIIRSQKL